MLRALGVDAADELGVAAQVGEDPAREDALGREDEEEVGAGGEAGALLEHGAEAVARGADRQRGLVGDERAGLEALRDVAGGGVHPAEVRHAVGVDEQRHHHDDGLARGDGGRGVGGGGQQPSADDVGELLVEEGLSREGLLAGVDEADGLGVDVGTGHLVTEGRELDREREADLAEGDDRDVHKAALH